MIVFIKIKFDNENRYENSHKSIYKFDDKPPNILTTCQINEVMKFSGIWRTCDRCQ